MADKVDQILKILGGQSRRAADSPDVDVIPTEFEVINHIVFGCGGIPRGRAIEMYAPESAGKTTFAQWLIVQVQKAGGVAAFFDAEGTFSPDYAESSGINLKELVMPDFETGNDLLYKVKLLLATNTVDLVVVDSIPAIQPEYGMDVKDAVDPNMRERLARAIMLTEFCNAIQGGYRIKKPGAKGFLSEGGTDLHKLRNKKTCIVFINHAKSKIGVMFGDKTNTPGGKALKFLASIRLSIEYSSRSKTKDDLGRPKYKISRIESIKNKLAPPFGKTKLRFHQDGTIHLHEGDVEIEYEELDDNVEYEE